MENILGEYKTLIKEAKMHLVELQGEREWFSPKAPALSAPAKKFSEAPLTSSQTSSLPQKDLKTASTTQPPSAETPSSPQPILPTLRPRAVKKPTPHLPTPHDPKAHFELHPASNPDWPEFADSPNRVKPPLVLVLDTTQSPEEETLLKNITVAIAAKLHPAQLVKNPADFLKHAHIKLIVGEKTALATLSKDIPRLELAKLSTYLESPQEKATLWQALKKELQ